MRRRPALLAVLSCVYRVRGGIPRYNQMLLRAAGELAADLGLSVEALSQDDRPEDVREAGGPPPGVAFEACGDRRALVRQTVRRVALARPRAVLLGHLGMTPLGLPSAALCPRGFGFVVHGMEAWEAPPRSRGFAARRARRAFVVSRNTGEALARTCGVRPDRIRLQPNALEPRMEGWDDVPEGDPPEILSVARLWAEEGKKGIDHTIEAFARLAPRHPRWRYRVVGKGSDKPRLAALARDLGIAGRVMFEEDLDDAALLDRYRRCAVFALPSGQEGFGIVFLEAYRFARPCVGGREGGTPEVVRDGVCGLLVSHGDVPALVGALDRLMSDPALRRSLGETGRAVLRAEYTYEAFRARLAGHLEEWLLR